MGEDEFVKRRIYLTLERGRDIALRNLLRRVYIAGGFDEPKEGETVPVRRTRIPVAEFRAAVSMGSGHLIDTDEVECLLANMMYKVSVYLVSFFSRCLRMISIVMVLLPRMDGCLGHSRVHAFTAQLHPPPHYLSLIKI